MKKIFYLYLIVTIVFIINVSLSFNEISFCGYWSDKIIVWLWLLLTGFIIKKYWKIVLTKIYFGLMLFTIFLSILPMGIPFSSMLYYTSTMGDYQKINLNEKYRLERTTPMALHSPKILIYKCNGLLEKRVEWIDYSVVLEKIGVSWERREELLNWKILNVKLKTETKDSLTINYNIGNQEGEFIHYLNETNEEHQKRYYNDF